MVQVPSIPIRPTSSGFIANGTETDVSIDFWREKTSFIAGPVDAPNSFINRQSECLGILDTDREELDGLVEKTENNTYVEDFYPWPIYEIQTCPTTDITEDIHVARVKDKLASVRSSKFAKEISDGIYSGSPSFRSTAVPISDTAYSATQAIARLVDARGETEDSGPFYIHMPKAFEPLVQNSNLANGQDYKLVFDNYVKSYVPAENIPGGGAATAPTGNQAWVAITGPYEYAFDTISLDVAETIDARRANTRYIRGEQNLYFRYETANTFLAKVTVFS